MAATAEFRTTIDRAILEQASAIYAEAGITLSDAFQRLLRRTIEDGVLPLDLMRPNRETLEAMSEARAGNLPTFASIEALMNDLNAAD